MSNVPMIPSGPSQKDIAEMQRLRNIMNGTANVPAIQQPIQAQYSGGYAGTRQPIRESAPAYTPTYGTTADDVNAMKQILERLNAVSGDDQEVLNEVAPSSNTPALVENRTSSGGFKVAIMLKEGANGKEQKSYDVIDATRQPVIENLCLQEAATAIMKYLNKGLSLQSNKVQEILELEETFNSNRIETAKLKQRYNRSVELGESEAAEVFKKRHSVARANALMAQDQIKSILESIR